MCLPTPDIETPEAKKPPTAPKPVDHADRARLEEQERRRRAMGRRGTVKTGSSGAGPTDVGQKQLLGG